MLGRRTTGSVVCPSCGSLVGVNDDRCYSCGRINPGLWGFAPVLRRLGADLGFAPIVMGGCTVLYVASLLTTLAMGQSILGSGFSLLAPSEIALFLFGDSGRAPVFVAGRWWTVLSASWLHGNILHILFNMLWVRQLGEATVDVFGPARTVIVYTVAGVCGFIVSSLAGTPYTLGASAAIFGLLGALVHYGRRSGSSHIYSEAMRYAVILFVFGFIMRGVDNFAHAGGFAGGYLASALVKPMSRERGDHMVIAAMCLVATLVSIVYSIISGLAFIR